MNAMPQPFALQQVDFFEVRSPLLAHAANVASQSGEDGIIARIFELLPPRHRYFVEFGAWDGQHLSNCWNLAANAGWGGCFIEANAHKFEALQAQHGHNPQVRCVNRFVGFEGPDRLDAILAEAGAPKDFDLLSVDVDGTDYFIWDSLAEHQPQVVVIEFNPTIPNDVLFVQARDGGINQGCSLLALIVLPLVIPILIFAVAAVAASIAGLSPRPHLFLLAGLSVFALTLAPFAMAAALRQAVE